MNEDNAIDNHLCSSEKNYIPSEEVTRRDDDETIPRKKVKVLACCTENRKKT